jgi:hypothetical protein
MLLFTDDFLEKNDLYVSHKHFLLNDEPIRNKLSLRYDGKEYIGTNTVLNFTPQQKKALRAFVVENRLVSIIDNCATALELTPTGTSGFYMANIVKKVYSETTHLINSSNFNSYEGSSLDEITDDDPVHIVFVKKDSPEPPHNRYGYIIN